METNYKNMIGNNLFIYFYLNSRNYSVSRCCLFAHFFNVANSLYFANKKIETKYLHKWRSTCRFHNTDYTFM